MRHQDSNFLVTNHGNMNGKANNRHSKYYDDRGIWESSKGRSSTKTTNNQTIFLTIFRKQIHNNQVRQGIKTLFVPIPPQPDSTYVVTMYRYNSILKHVKDNNSLKKSHMVYFVLCKDDLSSVAVY